MDFGFNMSNNGC